MMEKPIQYFLNIISHCSITANFLYSIYFTLGYELIYPDGVLAIEIVGLSFFLFT